MTDVIFTSYCFGEAYLDQQFRLRESILKIYPHANLHFQNEPELTGKPRFQQSLYGFKVRLVRECLEKGFTKIIFFDTAITLQGKVDYWFDLAKELGVLAPVDRQTLNNVTSNDCLKYLGLEREQIENVNLVGGSIYVFDFETELCQQIFAMWERLETAGMFGTQDDLSHNRLQSHRMDETCMALSFSWYGMAPLGHDVMRYAYEHPETKAITGEGYPIIALKKHFK